MKKQKLDFDCVELFETSTIFPDIAKLGTRIKKPIKQIYNFKITTKSGNQKYLTSSDENTIDFINTLAQSYFIISDENTKLKKRKKK